MRRVFFQELVKSAILGHRELERKVVREIWLSRKSAPVSESLDKELKFCEGFELCREEIAVVER
jgi:hypothetical protein